MTVAGAATSHDAAASTFSTVMEHVAQGFEALGAVILVLGVLWALILAAVV